MARRARATIPATRLHSEWIRLLEISGPFLSLPVLAGPKGFPQGLDAHDPEVLKKLRLAYEEWLEGRDDPEIHREWARFVVRHVLEHPDEVLREAQSLPQGLEAKVPEHHEVLRPDLAVVGPEGTAEAGTPRILLSLYPPEVPLEKPLPGKRWKESAAGRMALLLRGSGVPIGIVTNGERWQLVHAQPQRTAGFCSWYADLWLAETDTLRAFRSLLGPSRTFGPPDERLEALLEASSEYQLDVTTQIGRQVREAVNILVQRLDRANRDSSGVLLSDVSPARVYEAAVGLMMRLVFLFSAEERKLLPLDEFIYSDHYAISPLRDQLREAADKHGEEVLERRYDAWHRLLSTFRALHAGVAHEAMRLPAYGGGLFDPDLYPFLEGRVTGTSWKTHRAIPVPIDNRTVLHLLEALQLVQSTGSSEAQKVSFLGLDIEQLGHIYEGQLDRTVARADVPVLLLKGKGGFNAHAALPTLESLRSEGIKELTKGLKKLTGKGSKKSVEKDLNTEPDAQTRARFLSACDNVDELQRRALPFWRFVETTPTGQPDLILPGSLYATAGVDRRETGTHYTPRSITEPTVDYVLEKLVFRGAKEGLPRAEWTLKSPREILALRVLDMACGSGAFLVQACRYLSERLAEAWAESAATSEKLPVAPEASPSEARLNELVLPADEAERLVVARRLVADRCLYGVDVNPMAVELTKLSLWLLTLQKDRPFTFLEHAIRAGNSLLGVTRQEDLEYFSLNPKPGDEADRFPLFGDLSAALGPAVRGAMEKRLRIEARPVLSLADHDEKARLLEESREETEDLRLVADLLVGTNLARAEEGTEAMEAGSKALLEGVREFLGSTGTERVELRSALTTARTELFAADRGLSPQERTFHWCLEFPEAMTAGGFDAVIGNPPYLSLYSRDSLKSSQQDRRFESFAGEALNKLDGREALSGRVNFFLLFAVRAVSLGRPDRSSAGMVFPDTLVTNESYTGCRLAFTETGRLRRVVLFKEPVFRQATVGTCLVFWNEPQTERSSVELVEIPNRASFEDSWNTPLIEPRNALVKRNNCLWVPVRSSELEGASLPDAGSVPLTQIAELKDGINPGSKSSRDKLLATVDDGDPALRRCLEGKCISPHSISQGQLSVRYAQDRITRAEKKAGTSLRKQWIFDSPKIVYRQTAPHIIAAVDLVGFATLNSVHNVVLKENDEGLLFALCGYMNSAFFRDYYQAQTGETRKVFPQVHISSVKKLRVPRELLEPNSPRRIELEQLSRQLASGSDGAPSASTDPASDREKALAQIDELVTQMVNALRQGVGSAR